MSTEDKQFEKLLVAFEAAHAQRTRSLEAHMNKVKEILESETDGLQQTMGVKHTPISARLKDADKALRTLRRRQEDRKQLRELKSLVKGRKQDWADYCKEWNMEDKIPEAEPFANIEQMFEAMHDLAGIRISVYFPTDIQKVVNFLRGSHFKVVEKPTQKGGLTRDFQKVRKLVERQRKLSAMPESRRGSKEPIEKAESLPELTFPGYKATHVVVRLKDLDFDKHSRGDSITNIEVQIGSIVMHAWSDIEHDILYKPSEKASSDMVQMLDLINGIVLTGEVALQQLSRVADAETTHRTRPADNCHHVVTWLHRYFEGKNVDVPSDIEWSARCLFEILKATNEHNYGRVEALLNEIYPQPQPQPEACLPHKLLRSLGRETFKDPLFEPPIYATTWSARYWATCLINTINLALYTDCSLFRHMDSHSSKNKSLYAERPTFAEFVEILHPTYPQRRTSRDSTMIEFCKHSLTTNFDHNPAALAAVKLAAAGYVVRPPLSKDEEKDLGKPSPVFVPAMLKWLTGDHDISFHITLSLLGDDVCYDRNQFFIPRKEGRTWKPVRRVSGKRWVITKQRFSNDKKLVFRDTRAPWELFTDSLCNVLGMKTDPDEIRALRDMALRLNIADDLEKLRDLDKFLSALGTKNEDRVRQFIHMSEKINDAKGFAGLAELAELSHALDTMNIEELKDYRDLARSHKTRDADELRALKRLANKHGTRDPKKLKEMRNAERDAEEFLAHEQRGADSRIRSREDLANDENWEVTTGDYDNNISSGTPRSVKVYKGSGARLDPSWGSRPPSRRPSPTSVREVAQGGRHSSDSLQYRP